MPTTNQFSVDGTAVKIVASSIMPKEVHLHIASGAVYIGDSTVSNTTGLLLDNGDKIIINLADHEELWCKASSGTATIYVLEAIV
jgi:hypothetical protein